MRAVLVSALYPTRVPSWESIGRSADSCRRRTNAVGWQGMQVHVNDSFACGSCPFAEDIRIKQQTARLQIRIHEAYRTNPNVRIRRTRATRPSKSTMV
jgi:hypothetical protein